MKQQHDNSEQKKSYLKNWPLNIGANEKFLRIRPKEALTQIIIRIKPSSFQRFACNKHL